MAKTVTKYSIFLASPSDLNEERSAVEEVIDELNITYGQKEGIIFELLKWETHSAPGISLDGPQGLVNADIGNDYDMLIGLLWKRFGTKTNNAESGTEEEFNIALERFRTTNHSPQILVYFKNSFFGSLSELDPIQLGKVKSFQERLKNEKVTFGEFDKIELLKTYLRLHIPRRIALLSTQTPEHPHDQTIQQSNVQIAELIQREELGLLDYNEIITDSSEAVTNSLNAIADATEWVGLEVTKKTEELGRISKAPNTNPTVIKELLKRTAKLFDNYSSRIEMEIPIFYSNFEESMNASTGLLTVLDDFATDDSPSEVPALRNVMIKLRQSLLNGLEGMQQFKDTLDKFPRIQSDLNKSKRNAANQIGIFIRQLENCIQLIDDFLDEVDLID